MTQVTHGFKVGDEVVLLPRKEGWEDEPPEYTDDMVEDFEAGRVFTVLDVGSSTIHLEDWSVLPEWISPVEVSLDNV